MAQRITINQKKGYLTVRADSTGHIDLNSANTSVAANTPGEVVHGMSLDRLLWSGSATSSSVTIKRGANTIFIGRGQFGDVDLNSFHLETVEEESANLVFELSATTDAVLRVKKRSVTA